MTPTHYRYCSTHLQLIKNPLDSKNICIPYGRGMPIPSQKGSQIPSLDPASGPSHFSGPFLPGCYCPIYILVIHGATAVAAQRTLLTPPRPIGPIFRAPAPMQWFTFPMGGLERTRPNMGGTSTFSTCTRTPRSSSQSPPALCTCGPAGCSAS